MYRIRVACRTLVLFAILSFYVSTGYCVEADPYAFRTLSATIHFEYETDQNTSGGSQTQNSNRFAQVYSLNLRGPLFNRNLIVYDTGISWSDNNTSGNVGNSDAKVTDYFLRTTILPNSAIPLTLHASTEKTDNTGSGIQNDLKNIYGVEWLERIRPLPVTTVFWERNTDTGPAMSLLTDNLRVDSTKDIGPTHNLVAYADTATEDKIAGGSTDASVLNFNNDTAISRDTRLYLGATRSDSSSSSTLKAPAPKTELEGLSMGLTSRPSQDFSQNHNYNYFSAKTGDSKSQGNSYSGNLNYNFTKRLSTGFSLSTDESNSNSPSSRAKSNSLSTSDSVSYAATDNLSISESVSYSTFKINGQGSALGNLNESTSFSAMTNFNYHQKLNWSSMRAGYGAGYAETTSQAAGNGKNLSIKGLRQDAGLGFAGIDLTKYAVFNANAAYSQTDDFAKDEHSWTGSFTADGQNKMWQKYVDLTGQFQYNRHSSVLNQPGGETQTYQFTAGSGYFKNTTLMSSASYALASDPINGTSHTTSANFSASHTREVFNAPLAGNFSYTKSESVFAGQSQSIDTMTFDLKYTKNILYRVYWAAELSWSDSTNNGVQTTTTSISNTLSYQLRAWSLGAQHTYSNFETGPSKLTSSRLLFTATRSFIRMF